MRFIWEGNRPEDNDTATANKGSASGATSQAAIPAAAASKSQDDDERGHESDVGLN